MKKRIAHWTKGGALVAAILSGSVLSGCSDLLDVTLPSQLTDEVLDNPANAGILVNSFINAYETAWGNNEHYYAQGREAQGEIHTCGPCAPSFQGITSTSFTEMARAARFARELYAKLDKEWTVQLVPQRARYMALSSLYQGAVLSWAGSSLCEYSPNGGKLQKADVTIDQAVVMLNRALTEINAAGDFPVLNNIATSARTMANGLLANTLYMKGDLAGAAAAAALVPNGFFAYVTRESGDRRNEYYTLGTNANLVDLYDPIDWWKSPIPNPATNQVWPAVLPFTGVTYLGILPDGRAVNDAGTAIRTQAGPPPYNNALGVTAGAVADTRVPHKIVEVAAKGGVGAVSTRFTSEGDDIPIVDWRELLMIRAEAAGGQAAIDFVNQLRTAAKLPLVTYANPANTKEIRYMIMEEKRRSLYGEGRYYYTMLRNPDVNWFPRLQGFSRGKARNLNGGVRYLMNANEYTDNTNLTLADRGTGCRLEEKPWAPY